MNNLASKVGKKTNYQLGKELIKDKELRDIVRQKTVNEVCIGKFNTNYHRLSANLFLDMKEGLISFEKYSELIEPIKHLL